MSRRGEEPAAAILQRIGEKLALAGAAGREGSGTDSGALLRQRAIDLAREEPAPLAEAHLEVVEFAVGGERLAFESAWVREIFRPRQLQPLPGAPSLVAGLVVLRGAVVPVIDLRRLLHLPATQPAGSRLVLVLAEEKGELGIAAERVEGVRKIPHRQLASTPAALSEPARRYLRGVLPGGVALLDARLLLAVPAGGNAAPPVTPAEGGVS